MKRFISLLAVIAMISAICCVPVGAVKNDPKWIDKDPAENVAYSFALVGDTQILTAFDAGTKLQSGPDTWSEYDPNLTGNNYLQKLYKWIVDNKDERKIEYVFGLGDIAQHEVWKEPHGSYAISDWEIAVPAIKQLEDANIPYSMARGNHDRADLFNKNIDTVYYRDNHDGFYDSDVQSAYKLVTIGGTDYLFLTLELCPYDAELEWASDIIERYPDCKVIINTHGYMANNGIRWAHSSGNSYVYDNPSTPEIEGSGNSGPQIWEKLVKKHENIFMVLCGHIGANTIEVSTAVGDNGNTVYQVLVNPQNVDAGSSSAGDEDPLGSVALLNFYEDGSFGFEYYSTVKDKYYSNIKTIVPDTYVSTANLASARISEGKSGLRFKTEIDKTYLGMLVNTYGVENVEVGTLIAPTDKLAGKLTHASGVAGEDYVDVKATIASPFETTNTTNVYTGAIVNIKTANQDRDFTAVGYIKYKAHNGDVTYIYSTTSASKNVAQIAIDAIRDTSSVREGKYQYEVVGSSPVVYSKYTTEEIEILKSLCAIIDYRDPYLKDIFG